MGLSLSIVIPLYNMESTIRRTLNNLLKQIKAEDDIEIICIDDCSTDGTLKILEEYQDLKVIKLNNRVTTGKCRNKGIEKANKEFICFLDGDDLINLYTVRKIVNNINGADIGIGTFDKYDCQKEEVMSSGHGIHIEIPDNTVIETKNIYNILYQITNSACWNKVFRKEFIDKHNLRFSDCVYAEDMAFTCCALTMSKKLLFVQDCMITYTHPSTNPKSNDKNSVNTWSDLFKSFKHVEETIKYLKGNITNMEYNELLCTHLSDCVGNILYQKGKFREFNREFAEKTLEFLEDLSKEMDNSIKEIEYKEIEHK